MDLRNADYRPGVAIIPTQSGCSVITQECSFRLHLKSELCWLLNPNLSPHAPNRRSTDCVNAVNTRAWAQKALAFTINLIATHESKPVRFVCENNTGGESGVVRGILILRFRLKLCPRRAADLVPHQWVKTRTRPAHWSASASYIFRRSLVPPRVTRCTGGSRSFLHTRLLLCSFESNILMGRTMHSNGLLVPEHPLSEGTTAERNENCPAMSKGFF